MAQAAGGRPLAELDLGDQLRRDEQRAARRALAGFERRVLALQRREQLAELVELGVGEAGADAPGVAELAVGVIDADEQRADPLAPAPLAGQPAADHELLAAEVLDLQPAAVACAGRVGRVQPLGDDALELLRGGRREHVLGLAGQMVRRLPARAVELECAQSLAPLAVGQRDQRVPVEPQQVEDHVGDRRVFGEPLGLCARADVHPSLQGREARQPALVEGDDLAVEDRFV